MGISASCLMLLIIHLCSWDSTVNQHIIYTIYSLKHLMIARRCGLSPVTPAKLLTSFAIKDLFTNLKLLVGKEMSTDGFKATSLDTINVYCSEIVFRMDLHQSRCGTRLYTLGPLLCLLYINDIVKNIYLLMTLAFSS